MNVIYSFSLLHGFKTDTFDILGLAQIENELPTSLTCGTYTMTYPPWSNYNINGKPYWWYTKRGIIPSRVPTKEIVVSYMQEISCVTITGENLLKFISFKIQKIKKGDFRQTEIITMWKSLIDVEKEYTIINYVIQISSGGFVRYFGNLMKGTCLNINRLSYLIDKQ